MDQNIYFSQHNIRSTKRLLYNTVLFKFGFGTYSEELRFSVQSLLKHIPKLRKKTQSQLSVNTYVFKTQIDCKNFPIKIINAKGRTQKKIVQKPNFSF
ncbi:hypothetical protein DDV96_08235 [Marixanthomonas spongiae]|uniref:Uncharacterized protein n=1 Tax=Marixanthomonas spongiae TaxID=2174845 RepID=A0A2U0I069_9FLAO|nr:hypothetical protein DDV96_08235 [Marixanthomonas spongiae]